MARMRRTWLPLTTGSSTLTLGPVGSARILIRSLRQAEAGREFDQWTVTRSLLNLALRTQAGDAVVTVGLIVLNENTSLSVMGPSSDPEADWFYHEEFLVRSGFDGSAMMITRDIGGMRKARGGDRELYLYLVNRDVVETVEYSVSGRCLIMEA